MQFNPYEKDVLVSCGVKHVKFWNLCGNSLKSKKGIFGKVNNTYVMHFTSSRYPCYLLQMGEIQSIMCVAFGPNKTTYSGTLSGDIYIWNGNNLAKVLPKVHKVVWCFHN